MSREVFYNDSFQENRNLYEKCRELLQELAPSLHDMELKENPKAVSLYVKFLELSKFGSLSDLLLCLQRYKEVSGLTLNDFEKQQIRKNLLLQVKDWISYSRKTQYDINELDEIRELLLTLFGEEKMNRFLSLSRLENPTELLYHLKGYKGIQKSKHPDSKDIKEKFERQIESWFVYSEENEFRAEKSILKDRERLSMRRAVDASSSSNKTFLVSYLSILLYLAVAVSGVSDEQFLLAKPVKLPWLNIDIPLSGFFIFAPLILLATHFNLLYNLMHHLETLMNFARFSGKEDIKRIERFQLIPFLFNHLILSPYIEEKRKAIQVWDAFSKALSFLVLNFLPVGVFAFIQIRFSDYQSMKISLWHFLLLVLDIGISVYFFFKLGEDIQNKESKEKGKKFSPILFGSSLGMILILSVSLINMKYLMQVSLLQGEKDIPVLEESFKSGILFQLFPRIEVRGKNLVTTEPSDILLLGSYMKGDGNLEEFRELHTKGIDVRERNLVYAVIDNCTIINADFKGAHLEGAVFAKTDVKKANFHLAHINGAEPAGILQELRGVNREK